MTVPVSERQIAVVLDLLADGNPVSFTRLADAAGTNHLNTVAAELRARGYDVRSWRVPTGRDCKGRPTATWMFRLVLEAAGARRLPGSPPPAASSATGAVLEGAGGQRLAALPSAPSSAAGGDPPRVHTDRPAALDLRVAA